MHHRLRAYLNPPPSPAVEPVAGETQITVRWAEIQELVTDAIVRRSTWLTDFGEDQIQISADLYDVLMAYQRMRKGT